jgi:hypothetical protein
VWRGVEDDPASIGAARAAPGEPVVAGRWREVPRAGAPAPPAGGVRCPARDSAAVARHGRDDARPGRQRYRREAGGGRLDEVTGTGLAGHHRPLRGRVSRPYLGGPDPSDRQIAQELEPSQPDVQPMAERLRRGLAAGGPPGRGRDRRGPRRRRAQGGPGRPRRRGRPARRGRPGGAPGRGTPAKDEPPTLGLLRRGGEVVARMSADVRPATIRPVVEATAAEGALVRTDEDDPAPGRRNGAAGAGPRATPAGRTRGTRTATASARSTSARPRARGPCRAPGYGPPGRLAGGAAGLSRLPPVRPRRPVPREGAPRHPRRRLARADRSSPPRNPIRTFNFYEPGATLSCGVLSFLWQVLFGFSSRTCGSTGFPGSRGGNIRRNARSVAPVASGVSAPSSRAASTKRWNCSGSSGPAGSACGLQVGVRVMANTTGPNS